MPDQNNLVGFRSDLTDEQIKGINDSIELLMPEAKELVEKEPKTMTTKGNYGYYYNAVPYLCPDKLTQIIFINACLQAGGNHVGILETLKLLK